MISLTQLKFPKITFRSTAIEHKGGSDYIVKGNLTIRDITKPIEFKAELGGLQKDFSGQTVAGFELTGKLSRKEFGLKWHAVTESGGIVVGDEVKFAIAVEVVKQVSEKNAVAA